MRPAWGGGVLSQMWTSSLTPPALNHRLLGSAAPAPVFSKAAPSVWRKWARPRTGSAGQGRAFSSSEPLPLHQCPTPPAQTGNEVRKGNPGGETRPQKRRPLEVAAAAGEGEEWVERVGVQGDGASGDRGSGPRPRGHGRHRAAEVGGRGEGGWALFFRAHRPHPGKRDSGISGATVTSSPLFFLAFLGRRQREGSVSRTVLALVFGGGPGRGGEPFQTSSFSHLWPCCDPWSRRELSHQDLVFGSFCPLPRWAHVRSCFLPPASSPAPRNPVFLFDRVPAFFLLLSVSRSFLCVTYLFLSSSACWTGGFSRCVHPRLKVWEGRGSVTSCSIAVL